MVGTGSALNQQSWYSCS